MTEKFRTVKPCGMLYSQGREYFLLHPYPILRDSWQSTEACRWVVVPNKELIKYPKDLNVVPPYPTYYPPARHIVSNAWCVEYMAGMPEITVKLLEQDDVASLEWYIDENEREPNWQKLVEEYKLSVN